MNKNNPIKLIPALTAAIIDISVTAIHQKPVYWEGDLSKFNEGNPIGALFMSNHVSGLFIISGIELIVVTILGLYLPPRISKALLLFCVMAHSYAACTWITPRYSLLSSFGLILFNTILYLGVGEKGNKISPNMGR